MATLLHLGMQKTGSKALQRFMLRERGLLEANGIKFGDAFRDGGWHRRLFVGGGSTIRDSLRDDRRGFNDVLYSYEAGYRASSRTIAEIAAEGPVKILIYLRHPAAWVNSYFNQMIKAHRVTYRQIVAFDPVGAEIGSFLDVESHVKRWLEIAPTTQIAMSAFAKDGTVFNAFSRWLGIPDLSRQGQGDDFTGGSDPNPSADLRSLKILLHFKKLMKNLSEEDLALAMTVPHGKIKKSHSRIQNKNINILENNEMRIITERYHSMYNNLLSIYGYINNIREEEYYTYESRKIIEDCSNEERGRAEEFAEEAIALVRKRNNTNEN